MCHFLQLKCHSLQFEPFTSIAQQSFIMSWTLRKRSSVYLNFDEFQSNIFTDKFIFTTFCITPVFVFLFQRAMRSQDQALARTLLSLRHDIHKLKLNRSCQEHREMLDDVTKDMEEIQQLKDISDLHVDTVENPLKHLGVTSYNLTARRFSTC